MRLIKVGKFPIQNCEAEVKDIAIFREESSLETGDTYCHVKQGLPTLDVEETADGVKITCRESCRERRE